MNLYELDDLPRTTGGAATPAPRGDQWLRVVGTLGSDIAGPLTLALDRIATLIESGRIDRAGLRALQDEVSSARRAGMRAQQMARLAGNPNEHAPNSGEPLSILGVLKAVLEQREADVRSHGVAVEPSSRPVELSADPALFSSLLETLFDWASENTRSPIIFRLDVTGWPLRTALVCRFACRQGADAPAADGLVPLDSLAWHLLGQFAASMRATLHRSVEDGAVTASLAFARTQTQPSPGASGFAPMESDAGLAFPSSSSAMAGSHVLIVAARREVRSRLREAMRPMGLMVDMVTSVDDALAFCHDVVPHAIVVESALAGRKLAQLRDEVHAQVPGVPFIEIVEEGGDFGTAAADGAPGRVGRDAIETALPSVLLFELTRSL